MTEPGPDHQEPPSPGTRLLALAQMGLGGVGCLVLLLVVAVLAFVLLAMVSSVFFDSPWLWVGFIAVMVVLSGAGVMSRRK